MLPPHQLRDLLSRAQGGDRRAADDLLAAEDGSFLSTLGAAQYRMGQH